ncbi:MAG: HAD family phosphatase [Olegusella sp.]|nr:HAD family phosphatase [Olegusella sp.]
MADKAAIDNVVFDMGGVLMDFDTHLFSHLFVSNDDDASLIEKALYANPSWPLLDAGVISEPTMERMARHRLPQRLWEPMHRGFAEWQEHQPTLPAMNDQVRRLHDAGYGCYLLSNAGIRWWKMKERIPSFPYMDGFMVSAFERLMKPDPMIYQALCARYQLNAKSCLFVDDNIDNCQGAEAAGMQALLYKGDATGFERSVKNVYGLSY